MEYISDHCERKYDFNVVKQMVVDYFGGMLPGIKRILCRRLFKTDKIDQQFVDHVLCIWNKSFSTKLLATYVNQLPHGEFKKLCYVIEQMQFAELLWRNLKSKKPFEWIYNITASCYDTNPSCKVEVLRYYYDQFMQTESIDILCAAVKYLSIRSIWTSQIICTDYLKEYGVVRTYFINIKSHELKY